uniref:MOSC domain-containing protein n=1 Tax=Schlesneria paludicola TaxID=360056 RepID=A0A7C4QSN3_9PLAN
MPRLAAISLYPMKSCTGQPVSTAVVLSTGALQHDRQFALRDAGGRFWNAKRTPMFHRWRTWLAVERRVLTLRDADREWAWHLDRDRAAVESWFAERLGEPVRLDEDPRGGFPDDTAAPGPTVISTATLEAVAGWFPTLTVDDVRQRFRANLEIDGVDPFWEDRLYGPAGSVRPLRVGGVVWCGVNPCQRCVVPSRDPMTGEPLPGFQKVFSERRAATLPEWAPATRFDHFYRLAVNTRLLSGAGHTIAVGDSVELGAMLLAD